MRKILTGTSAFEVSPGVRASEGELRLSLDTQSKFLKLSVVKVYVDSEGREQIAPDSPKYSLSEEEYQSLSSELVPFLEKIWNILKINNIVDFEVDS